MKQEIDKKMLDIYSDYLISAFSYTTATGLSELLNNDISHDAVTRFLSLREYTAKDLWLLVKSKIREIETDDGVLIFDDTIEEKQHTDENEIICWHFDHSKGRHVKGVNILNCVYHNKEVTLPVSFEIIKKSLTYCDIKTKQEKRKSDKTKNELFREMVTNCNANQIKYGYILADIWFSAKDNMEFIINNNKHFIMAIKSNRTVALSKQKKLKGQFQQIESLSLKEGVVQKCYLKGLDFPILLTKQIFTNKDGSTGTLYLVTSDTKLDWEQMTQIYQKRWKVEEFHKTIKTNTGLSKSPTKTVVTQANHFFASIYAGVKLEILSKAKKLNHFALKATLYINALSSSFKELQLMKKSPLPISA